MSKESKQIRNKAAEQAEQPNGAEQPLEMHVPEVHVREERLLQDDLHIVTTQDLTNKKPLMDADEGAADEASAGDDELEIVMGTEADVTAEDLELLGPEDQDMDDGEDENVRKAGLDDTDFEGELLNEAPVNIDTTGEDLDIPDADFDDPGKEAMGQGDEENNYYSKGSDRNDNLVEGTP